MRIRPILHLLAAALLVAAPPRGGAASEVAAVVSPQVPVSALSAEQLADIYLGRSNRFPDGTLAVPCDLAEGAPAREAFYERVVGKTRAQMRAHWSKLIFTGRGQPPREVASGEDAKRLVLERPGTICYIDRALVDARVKILLVR